MGGGSVVACLDAALGRITRPMANLLPRRIRRLAEKLERERSGRLGNVAAAGFLLAAFFYALVVGGQIGRLGDAAMVAAGFGVNDIRISGNSETSELDIIERLQIAGGSLVGFDPKAARERVKMLPWIADAEVRKLYPGTVEISVSERTPSALWQLDGSVFVVDDEGERIVPLEEGRFATLPFTVGRGANERLDALLEEVGRQPEIASRLRAAVLVSERRWDLHLENGVVVKLPEEGADAALARLVRLNEAHQILAKDVVVIDLRLADRLTVRLPEGRSLDDLKDESGQALAMTRART